MSVNIRNNIRTQHNTTITATKKKGQRLPKMARQLTFLSNFYDCGFDMVEAAKITGVSVRTVRRWKKDRDFRWALDEMETANRDLQE